ncbi:unnamed protein product [Orchesella dallaii]|uniref:Presequence protease, mitochondrial n=1 Tax=Orchesella dallaii TaxID=48710 RepID=A0ABP1RE60_9HEXA
MGSAVVEENASVDSEFETVFSAKANDIHRVSKYRSKSTGLEIVHAEIEGPLVNGYIVLATRAEDDDGLPHTLEHLIFLGSEEFPYKGILDVLANKCLASGTNAWTDVDHTCYTLSTAGSEGFCTFLPIYMDHIFYPLLTDSAFKTEVYHTTGEGTDAGVVYSEIQAIENTSSDKSNTELTRTIYPPESGYHYQTGGVLKNLRETCNNVKVKDFHAKFYNPRNTCIIVCGMVEPTKLFRSLDPVIKKLVQRGTIDSWTKPWLEDVPEIPAPVVKSIKFPSDDEDEALVTIGFRGPSAIKEFDQVAAMRLLFEYLTDSSVGPVQQDFVETEDSLASSVEYSEMENSRTTFYFEFEGVDLDGMDKIPQQLKSTLENQVINFDMERMTDVIKKNIQEELSSMENSPHSAIAYAVIGDFLYGNDEQEMFEKRISGTLTIKGFLSRPKEFWVGLIQEGILNQKWIIINATPSKKYQKTLSEEEESRVRGRHEILGEPGLMKLAVELKEAMDANAREVPESFLEKINVPCTKSIFYHKIERYQNPEWAADFKANLYVDDINTNFVYVSVLLDTTSLSKEHKKYLQVFTEYITESPILADDGTLIPYEDVIAAMNRELLSCGMHLGIDGGGRFKCGSFPQVLSLGLQVEIDKIEQGMDWIRKILWKTQWRGDRIKVVANKMAGDVPQMKRKGGRMCHAIIRDLLYKSDSNVKVSSLVRQHGFLKELVSSLPKSDKKVQQAFDAIRALITDPNNIVVHISTCIAKLNAKLIESPTKDFANLLKRSFPFAENVPVSKRLANEPDIACMVPHSELKSNPKGMVLGLGAEDSAYLTQAIPGLLSFDDPDFPTLITTLQYFTQSEGPFWRGIRGGGFAYDYYCATPANEGLLYFSLSRCSDITGAYKTALDIIQSHLSGETALSEELLTSAKSSLIFEYIETEKTPLGLSSNSLTAYYRNLPGNYTRLLIDKISEVKLSDVLPTTDKYLKPLFVDNYACSVVCPSDKVSAVTEGLTALGRKLTIMPSLANSFLAKWD